MTYIYALIFFVLYIVVFFYLYKRCKSRTIRIIMWVFTGIIALYSINTILGSARFNRYSSISILDNDNINYKKQFHDRNNLHLPIARKYGVKPIANRSDFYLVRDKLNEITNNEYYEVARLTHSMPYLIPAAEDLLINIGKNFQDSLESKGLPRYKIVVTSLFRSKEDVQNLKKKGGPYAPQKDSPHAYGTTFDIAIRSFYKVGFKSASLDDLKYVLAEVLRDLRKQKKCYVLYEYTGCFHISIRKK